MTDSPQAPLAHGTFAIERRYAAAPDRVFAAWADPVVFRRWFVEAPGATIHGWIHDFRVGGEGGGRYRFGGPDSDMGFNETVFIDIAPNSRIIFSYAMGREIDGERLRESASLATVQLMADGDGTRLIYTEQGAYFGKDGGAHIPNREEGCGYMLDNLGHELEASA